MPGHDPPRRAGAGRDILVVGASAGGVEALMHLCAVLPEDLPAAVFVVQHVAPGARSVLPELLGRAGPLPAAHAVNGEAVRPGRVYVAPPDRHMLLAPGRVLLRRGPQENRSRPAVDVLFRSAAVHYGSRVVGAVLTGMLDDGTAGLIAVKRCGGISTVQDPADAVWPDMPRNALQRDSVDHCLALPALAAMLDTLSRQAAGASPPVPADVALEAQISEQEMGGMTTGQTLGRPSRLSCPHCGGVLNEIGEDKAVRFRCQTGHAYGPESLMAAQAEGLELALSAAVRTHRERLALFRRMAEAAAERGQTASATRWEHAAEEAARAATLIAGALDTLVEATAVGKG